MSENIGPSDASGVELTVTLPANAAFVSSVPPLVPVGNMLTYPIGALTFGNNQVLTVTVQSTSGGDTVLSGSVTGNEADPFPVNNAASKSVRIPEVPPTTAEATAIFSTFAGSNAVPGFPGVSFSDVVDLNRPARSARGNYWVLERRYRHRRRDDGPRDAARLGHFVRGGSQEGVTLPPNASPIGTFDTLMGVNNSGRSSCSAQRWILPPTVLSRVSAACFPWPLAPTGHPRSAERSSAPPCTRPRFRTAAPFRSTP